MSENLTHCIELALILATLCVLARFAPDAPSWLVITFSSLAGSVIGSRIVGKAVATAKERKQ